MPLFWWVGLDLVLRVGRALSGGVFWGVCELRFCKTLASLSANGWVFVPVLLVVCNGVSSTGAGWPLGGARS